MSKPLRVLIVEDSLPDAELLLVELRRGGYEPTYEIADTAEAMAEALDKPQWDVVLADYVMPGFGGLAALELLRAKAIDIPFIIVSGAIGEDVAVQAMKAGAHDYLLKGNLTRLVPAVERELGEAEMRRQRRKVEAERDRLAEQLRNVNEQLILRSIQIQEQAAETDAILKALAEAVVVFNSVGDILQMNPAAAELLDYSVAGPKKPILAQLAEARIETGDGKPFPQEDLPVSHVLRGETVRGVIAIIHRAASVRPVWVHISAAPILGPDGKPRGGVTIFTDITALCEQPWAGGPKA